MIEIPQEDEFENCQVIEMLLTLILKKLSV